jgi:transcriptional regulator GlxA family with amidase domain
MNRGKHQASRVSKQRRLARLRAMLLSGSATSVSTAAICHGFCEFGRLARDYRDMFGELPRDTLARGKQAKADA